jgi:proteasome lid subunit RPN8/RPN11
MDEMLEEAEMARPREGVGALLGRNDHVFAVFPLTNTETSLDHYAVDPAELVPLLCSLADHPRGLELLGFWHSHPRTSAEPSDLDRARAVPGYVYVVVGCDGALATFSAA